jgi:hypothetical protein
MGAKRSERFVARHTINSVAWLTGVANRPSEYLCRHPTAHLNHHPLYNHGRRNVEALHEVLNLGYCVRACDFYRHGKILLLTNLRCFLYLVAFAGGEEEVRFETVLAGVEIVVAAT